MHKTMKTRWQKELEKKGYAIINFSHDEIVEHLLEIFKRDRDDLLLKASLDDTKRQNLTFLLDYGNFSHLTIFAGTVNYSKKMRKFNFITYSDERNYAVHFSIESKVAHFCYENYKNLKNIFPFGSSIKRMTQYLLTH